MWSFRKLTAGVAFAFALLAIVASNRAAYAADTNTTTGAPTAGTSTIPLGFAGWDNGFFIRSPDGAFILKLRGYTQTDGRFFPSEENDIDDDGQKDDLIERCINNATLSLKKGELRPLDAAA